MHFTVLYVRAKQDLADPNQTWLVIIVCLLSLAMSLRMADAAGWIHMHPLARVPVPSSRVLIHQGDLFWDSVTDTRSSCLALLAGTLLVFAARLERQRALMMAGLYLLMAWWWVTSLTMLFQLGASVGGLYFIMAFTSSVATVKTLRSFDHHDLREADVDHSVRLVAAVLDLQDSLAAEETRTQETEAQERSKQSEPPAKLTLTKLG